jgi:hypothetical protein
MMTTSDLEAFFDRCWNHHDVELLMTFTGDKIALKSSYFKTRTG